MLSLSYDLHIHSCLSPCGDNDMTPANIVGMAAIKGLDVIAVTDHNSCKNCKAVIDAAEVYGIIAIPGMEICTAEEVHVICLFPALKNALEFDEYVYSKIPLIKNNSEIFGNQFIMDNDDRIIGEEELLLINACGIYIDDLYDLVEEYDGVIIPAHIDKGTNSLISNLGFIPPESRFKIAEIKNLNMKDELIKSHSYLNDCKIISNSDAHYLEYINEPINFLHTEQKSIASILKSLKNN